MKPWQINIFIVIGTFLLSYFLPPELSKKIIMGIIIGSTIWVYQDAKKINIDKYQKTALTISTTPGGTALVVFLLWLIAFPMYISLRRRITDGKIALKQS